MKNQRGITLVALVVTIIVLIILAGISVKLVLGDNGIIAIAKKAKENTELAKDEQNTKLNEYEKEINKYSNNGNDETKADDSWKDLSVTDKVEKLKNTSAKLAVFNKKVAKTQSDYDSTAYDDDFNSLGKPTSIDKALCECGKVREIFDKAIEMNLVKDYADVEIQTITSTDGTTKKREIIVAPIEEESIVLFDFYLNNPEQKPGIIPMPYSSNYAINLNGKEWIDRGEPDFSSNGGDNESILAWVNKEYAKNGFVAMEAKSTAFKNLTVTELGQVVHRKISVLTKTDFVKAIKALDLDLSEYAGGKCTHPIK